MAVTMILFKAELLNSKALHPPYGCGDGSSSRFIFVGKVDVVLLVRKQNVPQFIMHDDDDDASEKKRKRNAVGKQLEKGKRPLLQCNEQPLHPYYIDDELI